MTNFSLDSSSKESGSTQVVIVGILVVVLLAGLGFVFWGNFNQSPDVATTIESNQGGRAKEICADTDGIIEKNGSFCSESIGVAFQIPDEFVGKFANVTNYDITQGGREGAAQTSAGQSLEVYEARVAVEQESLTLSVAKEPLRSGYSSIGDQLQSTYFSVDTGILRTTNGDVVPSFDVSGVKIYKGAIGDAGTVENGYLFVIHGHLVIIKIVYAANPATTPTINFEEIFNKLDDNLKSIKFVEK